MMQYGMLETIIYLSGNAFRIYVIYLFIKLFFKSDTSQNRRALRCFFYVLFFVVNSVEFLYLNWKPSIIMVSNFVSIFIIAIPYSSKWKYRICVVMAIMAINIVCENLVYHILINLGVKHLVPIGITISSLINFMVVMLLQRILEIRRGENFTWQEWAVTVFIPGCSVFLSVFVFDNCENEAEIVASGISMILLNVFLFYLLNRISILHREDLQLTFLEQQNQAYENQIQLMLSSNEHISTLRHDIKNHFLVLHQMAQKDHCKNIQEYLENLTPNLEQKGAFVSTGNLIIDSLINIKAIAAANLGTEVKIDISISNKISVNQKDMCILLGNLLDNALRALENCKIKRLLTLKMRENQGVLLLQMENSYSEQIKKVGGYFKTTKEKKEGHGIGLKIVQRVVNYYQGDLEIVVEQDLFRVSILLYLQEK